VLTAVVNHQLVISNNNKQTCQENNFSGPLYAVILIFWVVFVREQAVREMSVCTVYMCIPTCPPGSRACMLHRLVNPTGSSIGSGRMIGSKAFLDLGSCNAGERPAELIL
jgi:hypothetical protein